MNRNTLVTAAFLGVFGTVCFIGGYFTGEYTTYDKNVLEDIYEQHNRSISALNEVSELNSWVENIRLVKEIDSESKRKEVLDLLIRTLSTKIEQWETNVNQPEYVPFRKIIKLHIEHAKTVVKNEKNS